MGFENEDFIGNPNKVEYTDDELDYEDHDTIRGALAWYNNEDDEDEDAEFTPDDYIFGITAQEDELYDEEVDDEDFLPDFSDDDESDGELRGIIENGVFILHGTRSAAMNEVVVEEPVAAAGDVAASDNNTTTTMMTTTTTTTTPTSGNNLDKASSATLDSNLQSS